jgi:Family of unknown function (DUF6932)
MAADKEEFTPLFPAGFHFKTLAELRAHCVGQPRFKDSQTRDGIMSRLEAVFKRLIHAKIVGEVWVDGSFLTEKRDPEDVDISLRVDGDFFDKATPDQRQAMEWITEIWDTEKIDGYLHLEWPPGHSEFALGQENYKIWQKQWGFSRRGVPKGIAVVELPKVNP